MLGMARLPRGVVCGPRTAPLHSTALTMPGGVAQPIRDLYNEDFNSQESLKVVVWTAYGNLPLQLS
jgi:hypothetical protein